MPSGTIAAVLHSIRPSSRICPQSVRRWKLNRNFCPSHRRSDIVFASACCCSDGRVRVGLRTRRTTCCNDASQIGVGDDMSARQRLHLVPRQILRKELLHLGSQQRANESAFAQGTRQMLADCNNAERTTKEMGSMVPPSKIVLRAA